MISVYKWIFVTKWQYQIRQSLRKIMQQMKVGQSAFLLHSIKMIITKHLEKSIDESTWRCGKRVIK